MLQDPQEHEMTPASATADTHTAAAATRRGGRSTAKAANALAKVVSALPGGGEDRPGQRAMCEAIAEAVGTGRHLVVAAGTGTGKSMAYLAAAAVSGKRTVVATATKALQDQLVNKDLPQLQQALEMPLRYALLKGRSNYVCRKKLSDWTTDNDDDQQGELIAASSAQEAQRTREEVRRIAQWTEHTDDGDRAGLDFEPSTRAWDTVSVSGRECPGAQNCPFGAECFAEKARNGAADADMVVVNTHLYSLHLFSEAGLLPPHELVVLDEAHTVEDIAAAAAGVSISGWRFVAAARAVRSAVRGSETAAALEDAGDVLREALRPHRDDLLETIPAEMVDAAALCRGRIDAADAEVRSASGDETRSTIARRCLQALADDLADAAVAGDGDAVWVEGPERFPVWRTAPIDVSGMLAERLWKLTPAVLTSATIPMGLADTLGIPAERCDTLDVGSPFDYEANGLLYCAKSLPDPRNPLRDAAAHEQIAALATAAGGRTLALFTSYAAMDRAADAVRDRTTLRVYTQRELPKQELVRSLTEDDNVCVFATMGMWQGVDIAGTALSLVILDRLPFPRPDDPLMNARRRRHGPRSFNKIVLPKTATMLAQGAGRLIRSKQDRGVVAILDSRLAKASYNWDLVRSLPPFRRTSDLDETTTFLAHIRDNATTPAAAPASEVQHHG